MGHFADFEYIPNKLSLNSVYPNPFTPITTINFSIPESGIISLNIYNIKGQIVEQIMNKTFEAGNHIIEWNASNHTSGIYFAKLKGNESIQIQKLMIIKLLIVSIYI